MKEKYYKKKASSMLASIIVIITSLIILSAANSSNVSAETSTATIRVKSTCSMTATVNTDHTASLINGVYSGDYTDTSNNTKPYENGIGKTTIQTFCNDPNGYAIYAIGYTGGDTGVANGTNTMLHSIDLGTSDYDIATGTATSGDISNWSMKLTALGDTSTYKPDILNGYNNYSIIPSDYTKVASYGSNTDTATIGSSLTTTYAAYISPTQPAGTYTGQVKYVLVHPASGLEPGTRYMQDVDQWANDIDVGDEVVAYDNRDNKSYTVRRMCMESTSNNDATWQEKEENCTDSMLWMTQNLDLDLNSSVALNSTNTDLNDAGSGTYSDGYVIDSDGVIYWTPANTTITSIDTSFGKFNGWIDNNNKAYSADPDGGNPNQSWYIGEVYDPRNCYVNNNNQTCNYLNGNNTVAKNYFSHTPSTFNGNHGKIGNYYNWSAAIASDDSSSLTTSTYNNVVNNPQNSICPRGWRLPMISSAAINSEFAKLNNIYNKGSINVGYNLFQSPLYLVLSGYINKNDGSLRDAGYYGYYWSSTVNSSDKAFILSFRDSTVNPANNDGRSYGWLVRCVSDY